MARTKQSLSTSTRNGSSFYRKLSPVKKHVNNRRKTVSRNDEYDHLLADLKDELTEKFEVELREKLAEATAKINKQKSEVKYRMNEKYDSDDEYETENSRQHRHPSWPWEPVVHSHQQDNYRKAVSRENNYEEEEPRNDWRQLTQYRNDPPAYKYEDEEYSSPKLRRPIDVRQPKYERSEGNPRYEHHAMQEHRQSGHAENSKPAKFEAELEALKDKVGFLEKELLASYQRETGLKTSVEKLEQEVVSRQAGLRQQLDTLRKDVVPATEPAKDENKLTSLSMQLTQVMQSMNTMMDDDPDGSVKDVPKAVMPIAVDEVAEEVSKKQEDKKKEVSPKPIEKVKESGKSKKKKVMWLFASLVLVIGGVAAGAFFFLNGQTTVDPELIKNYLPEGQSQSEQATPTSQAEVAPEIADSENGSVQGAATSTSPPGNNFEQSNADVAYGETRWDTHKNPQLGVQFDYPSNSANVVRTDTSVTVLRKTGYIFKIQYVKTALDLKDYWNQIKARNLVYKSSETTFRDLPALFLELDDQSDYPGNRYLVKKDDVIYDIWYAINSSNLSDDDAKRIDIILNSFKFLE